MISKNASYNAAGLNFLRGGKIEGSTGFNPAFPDVQLDMLGSIGNVFIINHAAYRLVLFDESGVAVVSNSVAHWKVLTPHAAPALFTVTGDASDSIGGLGLNMVAGIFRGVIVDGYYCLIQVAGRANCDVDAATVAGDHMIGGATDLRFGRTAAASAPVGVCFGTALEADTSNVAAVSLRNLLDY